MTEDFDFNKITMPSSRLADFHLFCLDSSVFIDFNKTKENLIYLKRISFDGYGCCNIDVQIPLDKQDSEYFIKQMKSKDLNQQVITKLVLKLIKLNKENIWTESLKEYNLI